jgi:hypothetical protein
MCIKHSSFYLNSSDDRHMLKIIPSLHSKALLFFNSNLLMKLAHTKEKCFTSTFIEQNAIMFVP